MASISSLGDLVGRILDGVDGGTLRVGFREEIQRGSASGSISVIEDREEEGSLLLRVALTVMKVPRDVEREFYHRLLQLNGTFQVRVFRRCFRSGRITLIGGQGASGKRDKRNRQ